MRRRTGCLLVGFVLLAGCGGGGTASPDKGRASEGPSSHFPEVTKVQEVGGRKLSVAQADWVRMLDGVPWLAQFGGALVGLDPRTGAEKVHLQVPSDVCTAMDVAKGRLVAAVCSQPAQLARVTPGAKPRLRLISLGEAVEEEGSVAASGNTAWVVTTGPPKWLLEVDLSVGRVIRRISVPEQVVAVRHGFGDLWLTDPKDGVLYRVRPATGKVIARVPVGAGARFFDIGAGAVWVQNNTDGTVSRVDPGEDRVTATITVAKESVDGGDLAVGGGFVWARVSDALVAKIDPATNRVVARYGPTAGSGSVAADGRAAWISAHDVDAVYRLPLG